jgi:hypothetical protein
MPGDLKTIGADIVANCIGVHPVAAFDRIARLRRDRRSPAQEYRCDTGDCKRAFHDLFPLLFI